MVRSLRKKFVLATMTLMLVVFGVVFVCAAVYNNYWHTQETINILEWLADSGVFLEEESAPRAFAGENRVVQPILGVVVDAFGEIESVTTLGASETLVVDPSVIKDILKKGNTNWQHGSYLYSIRELEDGGNLIVLADTDFGETWILQILGIVFLVALFLLLLSTVTFLLSNYVTAPAQAALEREKRFVSDASHELKTPLGAISINAQALLPEGEHDVHIQNILSETKRMNRLIERLLTLSRLEETALTVQRRFSLSDAVEEMVLTYESVAYEKHLEYESEIAENLSITGDEDEVKQLAAILIDNAIKHTPSFGRVAISLKRNRRGIFLSVYNTGKEIPSEALPYLFDRFYQAEASNQKQSFGLGLSIAKAIVQRIGGDISVESGAKGTTFFVEFPG